jgi:hypothetical protein
MKSIQKTGTFIISVLLLFLSIASIIGLYWLTMIVFTSKTNDEKTYTITGLTKTKMRLAQIAIIFIWLQIFLVIIGALWSASTLVIK